ncbi:MAG TPA: hypothetical protein VFQ49_04920 [Actinomycetes bacterium]|nr:hypothetical protein [Actinomycetes bacterium]
MQRTDPRQMRQAMADFVAAVHDAYLAQARLLPPAEQARLPLLAAPRLTVAAAGARNLHVIGTGERFPAPVGQEVEVAGEADGLAWDLRFFDPVVLPVLGLVAEADGPAPEEVRRVLGVGTYLYHLVVEPGSQLTPHHATHAGTGLASAHAAAARELETIRAHAPGRQELVDELAGATTAGLVRAQALLARELAPGDQAVAAATDPAAIRAALLRALGTTERSSRPGGLPSRSGGPPPGGSG